MSPNKKIRLNQYQKQAKLKNDEESDIPSEVQNAPSVSPSSLEDSTVASILSVSSASSSSLSWDEARRRRIAILEVYKHMGEPAMETWGGQKGIISTLGRVFEKTSINTIKKVLTDYRLEEERGNNYCGNHKTRTYKGEYMIPRKSLFEQVIADSMESGNGYEKTTKMVNHELRKEGKAIVGRSAVRESYLRLNPIKITVKKDRRVPMTRIQVGQKQVLISPNKWRYVTAS